MKKRLIALIAGYSTVAFATTIPNTLTETHTYELTKSLIWLCRKARTVKPIYGYLYL